MCNSVGIDLDFYKDLIIEFKNAQDIIKKEYFFTFISCAACQQLFKVATGIDSKIVGDTQILQSLRNAYSIAKDKFSPQQVDGVLKQAKLSVFF